MLRRFFNLHDVRRSAQALMVTGALVVGGACGLEPTGDTCSGDDHSTHVRPRVVVDGLISLSARTDGRVFVDEVVIHAPQADLRSHDDQTTDLLSTDPVEQSALLFRYSLGHAASGTAVGGDRIWDLSSGNSSSTLVFGFAPLTDDADSVGALGDKNGLDLDAMRGATAVIRGFIAVDDDENTSTGLTASGDPDGAPGDNGGDVLSGDPDGSPGQGPRHGDNLSGDPDGAPGRNPGFVFGGDPDGAPGRTGTESGDPDGAPGDVTASGDPDGAPGREAERTGGDPDGAPGDLGPGVNDQIASGDPDGAPGRAKSALGPSLAGSPVVGSRGFTGTLVPYVIIIDGSFSFEVPFADLRTVDDDSVVPIDVHVDADRVFTTSLLSLLNGSVAGAMTSGEAVVVATDAARGTFDVEVEAPLADAQPVSTEGPTKLEISGDPRDDKIGDEVNPNR